MKARLALILIGILMTGCTANYYVTPNDFIQQVAANQNKTEKFNHVRAVPIVFPVRYDANNIRRILCRDKNGKMVYLVPDRNTQLQLTSKSTRHVMKMYFDTVFFEGSKLVGQPSRMVPGMSREIELPDIEAIEIYAGFPLTEEVTLR